MVTLYFLFTDPKSIKLLIKLEHDYPAEVRVRIPKIKVTKSIDTHFLRVVPNIFFFVFFDMTKTQNVSSTCFIYRYKVSNFQNP